LTNTQLGAILNLQLNKLPTYQERLREQALWSPATCFFVRCQILR